MSLDRIKNALRTNTEIDPEDIKSCSEVDIIILCSFNKNLLLYLQSINYSFKRLIYTIENHNLGPFDISSTLFEVFRVVVIVVKHEDKYSFVAGRVDQMTMIIMHTGTLFYDKDKCMKVAEELLYKQEMISTIRDLKNTQKDMYEEIKSMNRQQKALYDVIIALVSSDKNGNIELDKLPEINGNNETEIKGFD